METYIADELPVLVAAHFPVDADRFGVSGHSMGGHGAITLFLKRQGLYRSLSAFAPIAHPSASDWGRKQFAAYLGGDEAEWASHDATLLVRQHGFTGEILVDQGTEDKFLPLLKPEALAGALAETRAGAVFRMQPGYDHSYFFVASFIEDHVRWHAERL
jgi:S-formylglutathione hydrolase